MPPSQTDPAPEKDRPYHHGDLRRAILAAALDVIAASGPSALSLRDLSRRAGVSHAAPAYHFKDRTGLLTAIAAEGYGLLAEALREAGDLKEAGVRYVRFARTHPAHFQVMFTPDLLRADDLELNAARTLSGAALRDAVSTLQDAVSTVQDAVSTVQDAASTARDAAPAGLDTAPAGPDTASTGLDTASAATHTASAREAPDTTDDSRLTEVAAWSLAHGFATLLLGHNLDEPLGGQDPEEAFRTLAGMMFRQA
ncbi:TetR/AcrR family transcriptional regulator [Streptomyces sp. NPDC088789]|uniref:TetR/AcrR family transcriptional regulator n=1 Tax=Streptomyces sp. NPDC088789 TaxID=3365899 RepID=UPI00380E4BA4